MKKFVSISTAVSAIPVKTAIGQQLGIAKHTVAIDEDGRAWEWNEDGLTKGWKPMPSIPEKHEDPS